MDLGHLTALSIEFHGRPTRLVNVVSQCRRGALQNAGTTHEVSITRCRDVSGKLRQPAAHWTSDTKKQANNDQDRDVYECAREAIFAGLAQSNRSLITA